MDVNYGGDCGSLGGLSRFYDEHKGKVLMVGDGSDVTRESGSSRRSHGEREGLWGGEGRPSPLSSNASEPLFASLYVRRNDGLVKIDVNFIIHSVLANEKA